MFLGMSADVPMKNSKVRTEQFNFRCEEELKALARKLTNMGVDVPTISHRAVKEALLDAEKKITTKAS
jgi:uncharacterized protein with PIN domain